MKHEVLTLLQIAWLLGDSRSTLINNISMSSISIDASKSTFAPSPIPYADAIFASGFYLKSTDETWGGISSLIMSNDGEIFVGVSDSGSIVFGSGMASLRKNGSLSAQLVQLQGVGVESLTTMSGRTISSAKLDGYFVLTDSETSPLLGYDPISSSEFAGLVFNGPSWNPMTLAASSLTDLVNSCPSHTGLKSILSTEPDAPELAGGIIFVCETPSSEDGFVHGWVYEPSTGESNTFALDFAAGSVLSGMSFCKACNSRQVFLVSNDNAGFAVDTVILDLLLIDGTIISAGTDYVKGLVRLFTVPTHYRISSVSVIPDAKDPQKLVVYVASDGSTGETVMLNYQVEILPAGSAATDTGDSTLAIIVLLILIGLGVVLPLAYKLNSNLRLKLDEFWSRFRKSKPKRVVLDESDEESAPRAPSISKEEPKVVGKIDQTLRP